MDRQRSPSCIQSMETECDLTDQLKDLKATYTAVVLSEPLPHVHAGLEELPYSSSARFCPYRDTQIGRPNFSISLSNDNTKVTLHIKDPLTAIKRDGIFLNIRQIFRQDLKYRVLYNKAGQTGKKKKLSQSSMVELASLDKSGSYCFSVAAFIPSRRADRQLGTWSHLRCSPRSDRSPLAGECERCRFCQLMFIGMVSFFSYCTVQHCIPHMAAAELLGMQQGMFTQFHKNVPFNCF
ncbi:tissue factor-like isoform X3 [Denticeps clupeoides]|nr:tissue factor-like isoform X3 [Denticeps clupeoides]